MKIATYNVNGIGARLPVLLRWLEETAPDCGMLTGIKSPSLAHSMTNSHEC